MTLLVQEECSKIQKEKFFYTCLFPFQKSGTKSHKGELTIVWLYSSSICMATPHRGEEEDSVSGNPEWYLCLQLSRRPESLASPHPQPKPES